MQHAPDLAVTARTTLRRKRERGSYNRALIDTILDEGLVAHVGFVADHGPVVLPMAYARRDDTVYLHGAVGNALLRHLASGTRACLTVTLLDGLVFARAAIHHSVNYRSVVLFGTAEQVSDPAEARVAATALLEHFARGRGEEARLPTDDEIRSTLVVRFPIAEGSAKVRSGGPLDAAEDLALPIWAGELPLATVAGAPVAAGEGMPVPASIRRHRLRLPPAPA